MGSVGIDEGYMDAGEFFVLKDVSDDVLDSDVGSDGELSYAVGVGVGVGVGAEVGLEVLGRGGDAGDAVALDVDGQGSVAEDAVAGAEVVADYSVDYEDSVDLCGGGEALAAGEVSPLLGTDDAGGLEPAIFAGELGVDVGAGRGCRSNVGCGAGLIEDGLAEAVDGLEVGAHALGHGFGGEVGPGGGAHTGAVGFGPPLHAGWGFIWVGLDGEDA